MRSLLSHHVTWLNCLVTYVCAGGSNYLLLAIPEFISKQKRKDNCMLCSSFVFSLGGYISLIHLHLSLQQQLPNALQLDVWSSQRNLIGLFVPVQRQEFVESGVDGFWSKQEPKLIFWKIKSTSFILYVCIIEVCENWVNIWSRFCVVFDSEKVVIHTYL